MTSSEKELEEQLKEIGSELLKPPAPTEALLVSLDKAECLLTNVEQSPTRSMQDALLPLMKALISDELLKHSDEDVKVTVISCITEITRITAPDAPYDDERMKMIFQLTVEAFKKLSNVSGRCYTRALSILDAVAKVRSCLVMLDLECDNLVLEMFQNFLKLIRSNHPPAVFSAMEAIMTNVLDESEEISSDLLSPILASVRKENQEAASISWKLGKSVISNCSTKLQPYLMGAVLSLGASLDDFAPIVTSICQNETESIDAGKHLENVKSLEKGMNSNEPTLVKRRYTPNASIGENPRTDCVSESLISNGTIAARNDNIMKASSRKSQQRHSKQSKMTETKKPDSLDSTKAENALDSVPKKRGRKPNSLMNPDEGYDHYWIGREREKSKLSNRRKSSDQETKISPSVSPRVETASLPTEVEKESSAHVEEKHVKSKDAVVYENMNKMEEKAQASSRKSKVVKSKKDKATLDPGCVVSEEKVSAPSDCKEKRSVHLVMKLRVKSTNGDVQKDVTVKSVDTNMDKNIHKLSIREKKVSRSAKLDSDDYLEETPKAKATRKHAIVKEEVMDESIAGGELVGRRIKVWWPLDRKFYEGVVHSFDSVKKKHKVSYDDGDEEILNLNKQRYELIGGDALPVGDEEMDVPKPEASSDILQKRKRKIKSGSAKKEKTSSSTRRGRASAKRKSEVKSARSSGKAANSSMLEKPVISDESTDDAASVDNSSRGNDKKLIDMVKNNRLRISLKSKQNAGSGEVASSAKK